MAQPLTVLVPCKNEAKNLRLCIESVRDIADEILVADSGSTDGTQDLARSLGGRLIEREYIHSGNFKNWAIPQATHAWVLIVDADERVTPELAAEIKAVLAAPQHDGYRIRRRNHIFGREIKHCGWNNDQVLRLFRRDVGRYCDRGVHADLIISTGNVGRLKACFLHFTYWSAEQYLEKFDRYTKLAAGDLHKGGHRATFINLLLRGPLRFFQLYVLKRGFLDGVPGLILCMFTAFYSFTKYAKLWALHSGIPQPDPEAERRSPRIEADTSAGEQLPKAA